MSRTIMCALLGLLAGCRSGNPGTPRLFIVYGADSALASQYAAMLESQGFSVTLLPVKATSPRALARADVLLLTPGASGQAKRQSAATKSTGSSRPIVALPGDLASAEELGAELHQILGRWR